MKNYLFKKANGNMWNIFLDNNNKERILFRTFNQRRQTFNEPTLNINNIRAPFSCDMDAKDNIHLAFLNKNGDIYYGHFDGMKLNHFPILVSKKPTSYDKNLTVTTVKGRHFIFYTLRYKDDILMSMQEILPEKNLSLNPIPVDKLFTENNPYKIVDQSGFIFIIYIKNTSENESSATLGFKIYSLDNDTLSNFYEINIDDSDLAELESTYIDNNDTLIIFAKFNNRIKELRVYDITKKAAALLNDENPYLKAEIIDPGFVSDEDCLFCSGIQVSNLRYIYYCFEDSIYYYKSVNGNEYGALEKINIGNGKMYFPLNYKSNDELESAMLYNSVSFSQFTLPARLYGYITIHFFNPFSDQKTKNININRTMLESIQLLKTEIEKLDTLILNQNKRISKLEADISNLEREIDKLDVANRLNNQF